jgi:hypothetical protein
VVSLSWAELGIDEFIDQSYYVRNLTTDFDEDLEAICKVYNTVALHVIPHIAHHLEIFSSRCESFPPISSSTLRVIPANFFKTAVAHFPVEGVVNSL